jgi:hypothetical protein
MLRSMLCVLAILLIAASELTMVEVRTGGDDGLTQRLADQVRATFAATQGYTAAHSPKRLIITIPTHVQWREIKGRTKITYHVEIASGSKSIRRSGSCWETDMPLCAHQVVTAATAFKRS